jgi:hypothetical protein
VSRSLDLTGSNWRLRKDAKTDIENSWGWVGLALLMRDAGDPLHLQACMGKWGEIQVEFSWI